jgi:hypothetical protein
MSPESRPIARSRRRSPRVPPFFPVPLRATRHGWTAERQAHFIGCLAERGSVSDACARVGMSRKGAYKLRQKPGAASFAAAWDAALGAPARKVTIGEWDILTDGDMIHPRFRSGRYVGYVRKPDLALLSRLLREVARAQRGRRG